MHNKAGLLKELVKKSFKKQQENQSTPVRTHSISGLKSQFLKLPFCYFEIDRAPSELLLSGQANSAFLAVSFALGSSNSEGSHSMS